MDELLQAEKIDEEKLYAEYLQKSTDLFRNGRVADNLRLWQEAYHKMPNNIDVQEMLMSAYFDTDKCKYRDEIIELGTKIYNSDAGAYYKGQAVEQLARTHAETGNYIQAENWAAKAFNLMHAHEFIRMQFLDDASELKGYFAYVNYWYIDRLFCMAARINSIMTDPSDADYTQSVNKAVVQIYETVYPNDDMGFEDLQKLCILHRCIAEDETNLAGDETVICRHLTRAMECAVKSISVEEHSLPHPLVKDRHIAAAPSDNTQIVRQFKNELAWACFDSCRNADWFTSIEEKLNDLL